MMYAKSFMALDGNDRLVGARTAQTAPDDCYCSNTAFCGERYCLSCQTGKYSSQANQPEAAICEC